jgi:hypothetical protein
MHAVKGACLTRVMAVVQHTLNLHTVVLLLWECGVGDWCD